MKKFGRFTIVGATLFLAAFSATAALADPGFITCQATESARQLVFTTPTEFRADSADADKAFDYFIKAYQAGKVPLLHADLSHVQGICHWEAKEGVAMQMTTNYMINFLQQGYLTYSEVSMPDPFVPAKP